jgi:hypothetical protein
MHLSRVLSPVKVPARPSDLRLRTFGDGPLGVFGVPGPFDAMDPFLAAPRMSVLASG